MSQETATAGLPLGIGTLSRPWLIFMGLTFVIFAFGVYAYLVQLIEGEVVTGLRNLGTMGGVAWGLYIVFAVYFAGVAFAGITLAALIRLFDVERLKPVARLAALLSVGAVILGAISIMVDLGRPLEGITNLFLYARPQSPFFGTFTLVIAGYFFASVTYLYLESRKDAATLARRPGWLQWFHRLWAAGYKDTPPERERRHLVSRWLSVGIIVLTVVATSTLGFVFGLQVGRPGWYSALQAPTFVVLAGISGLGNLIVLAALVRRLFHKEKALNREVFKLLGKFMLVLVVILLYFLFVDLLTSTYAATPEEVGITNALLFGEYAWMYWLSIATIILPLFLLVGMYLTGHWSIWWLAITGVLVNVAAILKRYLIVVPSQTHGSLLPYGVGTYAPTWVEYAVILGLLALGALLFGLFAKVFPVMEVSGTEGGE
ncbi:MAG: NrfD/PsrC family molybdoenzyme membrane anchor subunit [Thermoplasmata archaeon]